MSAGKAAALRAVKTMAAWHDRLRRPAPGIVVLIYHRVGGGSGTEMDLPAERFEQQMAWLAAERRVITLDDALALLASPRAESVDQLRSRSGESADRAKLEGRDATADATADGEDGPESVVVTFDDGTADLAEVALPILDRHRIPATLYLATEFVDSGRSFPADGTPLSWAAVREMVASGWVTVGSHTHTHALLDRLSPGDAAGELDRSIELIGERVGVAAEHFAYPKAVPPGAPVEELVRGRFRSAALAGNRPNPYGRSDPHRLARSAIQVSDGMAWFTRKARGGMAFEDTLRRTLNRARYARATS